MKTLTQQVTHSFTRIAAMVVCGLSLVGCASSGGSGLTRGTPDWAVDLVSYRASCTDAAAEAKSKALASGIAESRLSWMYGKKPFTNDGHVSLVIDGWLVVDNGGLGRNVWGEAICPGNVCTVSEVQRGYDRSFFEPVTQPLHVAIHPADWKMRATLTSRGNAKQPSAVSSIASRR